MMQRTESSRVDEMVRMIGALAWTLLTILFAGTALAIAIALTIAAVEH